MKKNLFNSLCGFNLLLLLCFVTNTAFSNANFHKHLTPVTENTIKNIKTDVAVPFVVTTNTATSMLVANTGSGCTSFNQQPQATAVCEGETAQFMVEPGDDFPAPVTYQWESSTDDLNFTPLSEDNTFSNTNSNTLSVNSVTNLDGLFFRAVVNGADCSNISESAKLTVHATSLPDITGRTEVCAGSSTNYSIDDVGTAYEWSINGGGAISGTNSNNTVTIDWNNNAAGNYIISVQVSLPGNCSNTQTYTVNLEQTPEVTIDATDVSCFGVEDGTAAVKLNNATPASSTQIEWSNQATSASIDNLDAGQYTVNITTNHGCTASKSVTINEPSALVLDIDKTNVTCFNAADGTAMANVSGGTVSNDYQYNWSNNANTADLDNLAPATYTLTVKDDNNCSIQKSVSISQPSALELDIDKTNVTCFNAADGTAMANVSGGTVSNGYQYNWSNNATTSSLENLAPATYTLTVKDDNNCSIQKSVSISQPSALELDIDKTNVTCFNAADGTAMADVSGGTVSNGYQYNWSNNATTSSLENLAPATYTLTVKDDNNCSIQKSVSISQPSQIMITADITDATCPSTEDGAIEANVTGGTPGYSYQWKEASGATVGQQLELNNIGGGTYTLLVTDANNCMVSKEFNVGETDSTKPTFDCQVANNYSLGANGTLNIAASSIVRNAQDNCGIASITFSNQQSELTFDCSQTGQQSVTLVVKDVNGNSESCTRSFNIIDNTVPSVNCPTDVLELALNEDGIINVNIDQLGVTASDNCEVASIAFTNQQTSRIFTCDELGQHTLNVEIKDANGNSTICNRKIKIVDNTSPMVQCNGGFIQLELDEATGTVSVSIGELGVNISDNCTITNVSFPDGSTQRSFNCNDAGKVYNLTVEATDNSGNNNSCIRQVIILDLIKPVLQCDEAPIVIPLDEQDVVTLNVADLATATDNCSVPSLAFSNGSTSRDLSCSNITGLEQIEIVATDEAGNKSSCFRDLDVIDREAPTINCNSNRLYVAALGTSGTRTVNAIDLISAVTDDCSIESIEFTDGTTSKTFDCNSITPQNGGFHALTVVVRDNGVEIASCTRLLLVLDTEGVCE